MMAGALTGQKMSEVSFVTGAQSTLGHVDGEAFTLPPQSSINVSLANESLFMWSLRAADPSQQI
jgi:hypothetical protein